MTSRRLLPALLLLALATCVPGAAVADAPIEVPTSKAGLIFLDAPTLRALRKQVRQPGSGAYAAVADCRVATARPDAESSAGFQGERFASLLASCALAYRITGRRAFAVTAMRYFRALLSDFQKVGDGKGGADVVTHDTGYAMRFFATFAALGYDWLYDAPGMSASLRSVAETRFREWTSWYRSKGYLRDVPGANYHAGFVVATTLIAVVQERHHRPGSAELLRFSREQLIGGQLANAVGTGGPLEGGGWPEGWQYGPLAVLEYALAARALAEVGAPPPAGLRDWTAALVTRYRHGLSPDGKSMFVGGDTGAKSAYLPVDGRILYAAVLGPSSPATRTRARRLLRTSGFKDRAFPVFQALAEASGPAADAEPLPAQPALVHLAEGTGTLYARSSWARSAFWFTAQCSAPRVPDHQHPSAGTFTFSRGQDHLITDPSPYGSMSTLTGNAPTAKSRRLPAEYQPSQGYWGRRTRFSVVGSTSAGVVIARCDYADQYRFKDQPSDMATASRWFILHMDGNQAQLVVWDRIEARGGPVPIEVRFRSPGRWRSQSLARSAVTVGKSRLSLERSSQGPATTSRIESLDTASKCWEGPRGRCRASRHRGTELRVESTSSPSSLVHRLVAGKRRAPTPSPATWSARPGLAALSSDPLAIVELAARSASEPVTWFEAAPGATVIVLDGASTARLESRRSGKRCQLRLPSHRNGGARVVELSASCAIRSSRTFEPR